MSVEEIVKELDQSQYRFVNETNVLLQNVIDIINNQQAEIRKLQNLRTMSARIISGQRAEIEKLKNMLTDVPPDTLEIKVKYFDKDIEQIQKISVGDWLDLRSADRVELKAGEYKLLRLGVGMILPDGYEALVLPRSSTPGYFGIMCANSMGVIDNSYSGDADEWRFPAVAIRDTVINKGDRIAQFRIIKNQPAIEFKTVEHLNDVSRGGIGSTGAR